MSLTLNSSVLELPRIGQQRAKRLEKLHLFTAQDLLYWFPREYQDLREIYTIENAPCDTPCCVAGVVASVPATSVIRKGMAITKVKIVDEKSTMHVTFFNQTYVKNALVVGESYIFYAQLEKTGNRRSMTNPIFEQAGKRHFTGRIMPIYPLTAGITNYMISECVRQVLVQCGTSIQDPLPQSMREQYDLLLLGKALQNIHFPSDFQMLKAAKRRFVFEELLFLSLGLAMMKEQRTQESALPCQAMPLEDYTSLLPFTLTGAQQRAMAEASKDLCRPVPMNRLIQGDVGSGKTVVAAFCAWMVGKSGGQAALMVPTEILAEQHYRTLAPLLEQSGLRVGLLTGSLKAKQKRDIYERLALGMIDFIVGTHALLSEGVTFCSLQLVITDEQHRFGVEQRARLANKGRTKEGHTPHTLVMSATPIPRTLALVIYGDLDVSIIDELPPNRQNVDTFLIGEDKRERMYSFVKRQIDQGHQVYIVCPSVSEESALERGTMTAAELKAVEEYAEELQNNVFPQYRVGLVHGKQKPQYKEQVMTSFSNGELDILVSTTVIEVGVDVPNATLMVIENAERFGLSQLHQLRGRVGRGKAKSYCVLVSDHQNAETRQRMKSLCATNNGFELSEADLKLRGPGDFFGSRQHGLPQLKVADLASDMTTLDQARAAAEALLSSDPYLHKPEHCAILRKIEELFQVRGIEN